MCIFWTLLACFSLYKPSHGLKSREGAFTRAPGMSFAPTFLSGPWPLSLTFSNRKTMPDRFSQTQHYCATSNSQPFSEGNCSLKSAPNPGSKKNPSRVFIRTGNTSARWYPPLMVWAMPFLFPRELEQRLDSPEVAFLPRPRLRGLFRLQVFLFI